MVSLIWLDSIVLKREGGVDNVPDSALSAPWRADITALWWARVSADQAGVVLHKPWWKLSDSLKVCHYPV